MPDFIDRSDEIAQRQLEAAIGTSRAPIAVGEPGECKQCGQVMPRLIGGRCGYCRDGRR